MVVMYLYGQFSRELDVSNGDPQYKQSLLKLNVESADLKLGDSDLLSFGFDKVWAKLH